MYSPESWVAVRRSWHSLRLEREASLKALLSTVLTETIADKGNEMTHFVTITSTVQAVLALKLLA